MRKSMKKGFSILEIIIVIAIIAVLTAAASASYNVIVSQSQDTRRKLDLAQIAGALELYKTNTNAYPNILTTLTPSYIRSLPKDPVTKQDYVYTPGPSGCTNTCTTFTLRSILSTKETFELTPQGSTNLSPTP
jgi:general secretion pathway protein G